MGKIITVSVISELTTDQRVIRICTTLCEMGFEVKVIARSFPTSLPLGNYIFIKPYTNIIDKANEEKHIELQFTMQDLFDNLQKTKIKKVILKEKILRLWLRNHM